MEQRHPSALPVAETIAGCNDGVEMVDCEFEHVGGRCEKPGHGAVDCEEEWHQGMQEEHQRLASCCDQRILPKALSRDFLVCLSD